MSLDCWHIDIMKLFYTCLSLKYDIKISLKSRWNITFISSSIIIITIIIIIIIIIITIVIIMTIIIVISSSSLLISFIIMFVFIFSL